MLQSRNGNKRGMIERNNIFNESFRNPWKMIGKGDVSMRYYNFAMNATSDQIKEKTKIVLRNYSYNTMAAVNNYIYKCLGKREIPYLQCFLMMRRKVLSERPLIILREY